jgi:hypothetical protein
MELQPYTAPWVFQDYTPDHPGVPAPVHAIAEAIVKDDVGPHTMRVVGERYGVADWTELRAHLVDLVLYYVRIALSDHSLSDDEIATSRLLKRLVRLEEGDFWMLRRDAVRELVQIEMARILRDGVIDKAEELHQVDLQSLFDLSYDQYLSLSTEAVADAVSALEGRLEDYRRADKRPVIRIEESGFLQWLGLSPNTTPAAITYEPNPEIMFLQRCLASIEVIYRLQGYQTEKAVDQPGRGISQEVKDQVWRRDGGKCVSCSRNALLEFDHIIPYSKGGASTYRNVQLLCQRCNRTKSAAIGIAN